MREILKKITYAILLLALATGTPIVSYAEYTTPVNITRGGALNYDNPNKNIASNPYRVSTQGVLNSNLLMAVVGCTGIVNKISKATTGLLNKGSEAIKRKATQVNRVPTTDELTQQDVEKANAQLKQDAQREECFNGIAFMLAKNQLTAMTKATMNWVNSGLEGNPLYVQNQNSFLGELSRAVVQRGANIFPYDTYSYPYGRTYSRSLINYESTRNGTFEARIGLNLKANLLNWVSGGSISGYSNDFSRGGWNGWLALTQQPQNNPLGFTMSASQQIADEKEREAKNKVDEINRNQGYLDQRVCKATKKQQDQYANAPAELKAAQDEFKVAQDAYKEAFTAYANDINNKEKKQVAQIMKDALDKAQARLIQAQQRANISVATVSGNPNINCTEWETVTPGSTIRDKVSTYINSPELQLTLADTLNESLNALFTALISKFESSNGGLAGLSSSVSRFTSSSTTQTSTNSDTEMSNYGGFNGSVDITKDLPDIIQTQKDYIKVAKEALQIAPKVVPAISALDYCIPGPNPSWQENSEPFREAYFDYLNNIGVEYVQAKTPKWKKIVKTVADPFGIWNKLTGAFKKEDISFFVIRLPNESPYANLFPNTSNLWPVVKYSNHDPLWLTSCNNPSDCYNNENRLIEDPDTIETEVITPFTDWVNTYWNGYVDAYKSTYGISSPMQTEIIEDSNGNLIENPQYLPMAQAGLNITKNLKTTAEDISISIEDYTNSLSTTDANIYKLNQIKKEVDIIVASAQEKRKKARIAAGLPPISAECLALELGQ